VYQFFCVNGQVLFLRWGAGEMASSTSPAQRFGSKPRFHLRNFLSGAGMSSGQRIVKWFSASRQ
jgi:hypothetical protein